MKKRIMFIIVIGVFLIFVACKKNNQETNFIPDQPSDITDKDDVIIPNDPVDDFDEPTDIPDDVDEEPEYVGETNTKYVKLRTYGSILNVRSEPSTEGDNVVGFLVHTEPIEVISIDGDWAKIMFKDEIGYVSAAYLVDTVPPYVSPPTLTQPEN